MDRLRQCSVNNRLRRNAAMHRAIKSAMAFMFITSMWPASAGTLEQAKRIHDRLAGAPPSSSVLTSMQTKIAGGDAMGAAYEAMDNPAFYNATLKNWATPWTNRDGNKFAPLNDYTATVIGIVRDSVDYRQVLFGNIIYIGANGVVSAPYSNTDNNHYVQLEANDINLGNNTLLVQRMQTAVTGLTANATAGIATTRAAARAFFIDGTNRAMFRFTLKNHLCNDLEQVQDTTRPADRIRRDVSRSPGGDSRLFMNTCVGCHSGMDPMAQAFAYYNFAYPAGNEDAGQLTYRAATDTAHDLTDPNEPATPGGTERKYHINESHFQEGYETLNDNWDNYWRAGPNTAIFGWGNTHTTATSAARNVNGIYGDAGAKTMMEELANSQAFAVCSVKKVFKTVCLRDPASGDQAAFTNMLNYFNTNHDLKHTFAEAAVYCSGN